MRAVTEVIDALLSHFLMVLILDAGLALSLSFVSSLERNRGLDHDLLRLKKGAAV